MFGASPFGTTPFGSVSGPAQISGAITGLAQTVSGTLQHPAQISGTITGLAQTASGTITHPARVSGTVTGVAQTISGTIRQQFRVSGSISVPAQTISAVGYAYINVPCVPSNALQYDSAEDLNTVSMASAFSIFCQKTTDLFVSQATLPVALRQVVGGVGLWVIGYDIDDPPALCSPYKDHCTPDDCWRRFVVS